MQAVFDHRFYSISSNDSNSFNYSGTCCESELLYIFRFSDHYGKRCFTYIITQVNLFLIMFLGRQVVRSIWFPYGSKLITLAMDGQTNERFGEEFIKILERTHSILQNKMIQNQKSDDADQIINEEEFWNQTATHTQRKKN